MIHGHKGRKLGRTASHRKAMLANQAISLFRHGRIRTTLAKSKELRPYVEKLITKAKNDTVHSRRLVAKEIHDKAIVQKLFDKIALEFEERPGGYTQIFKIGPRPTDGAMMSYIQLVGYEEDEDED